MYNLNISFWFLFQNLKWSFFTVRLKVDETTWLNFQQPSSSPHLSRPCVASEAKPLSYDMVVLSSVWGLDGIALNQEHYTFNFRLENNMFILEGNKLLNWTDATEG